jgi:hypothetical protein
MISSLQIFNLKFCIQLSSRIISIKKQFLWVNFFAMKRSGFQQQAAIMLCSKMMAVFWVVAPCSLVGVYQLFRGPYCLHRQVDDDGGSKDILNVGKILPDYTALQLRRQPSSYSPPWEPQIMLSSSLFSGVMCLFWPIFFFHSPYTLSAHSVFA